MQFGTPKKATITKRGVSPGGAVGRGLHLLPHQRQAIATMEGPPASQGATSPLKPEAAAALARLKHSRLASIAQRCLYTVLLKALCAYPLQNNQTGIYVGVLLSTASNGVLGTHLGSKDTKRSPAQVSLINLVPVLGCV